jgi:hypothetical protein
MTLIVLDEAEMEFLEAVLMKSVIAAKAVLFPEAEEKAILPREIVVNMEGEQH